MALHDQRPSDWMLRCVMCEVRAARRNGVLCAICKANLTDEMSGGSR